VRQEKITVSGRVDKAVTRCDKKIFPTNNIFSHLAKPTAVNKAEALRTSEPTANSEVAKQPAG